jgi:hypothetical protein
MNPTVKPWRCFARCWSCGGEVPPQHATRSEVQRPMHWSCPACEVRWIACADRVEASTQVMAS